MTCDVRPNAGHYLFWLRVIFDGLTSQFNACSTRCIGSSALTPGEAHDDRLSLSLRSSEPPSMEKQSLGGYSIYEAFSTRPFLRSPFFLRSLSFYEAFRL
jgi:hypothetical protein